MNYIEYDFETENADQAEQLIALLSDEGFEGFEEEGNSLKAFIPEDKLDAAAFDNVIAKFAALSYTSTSIENINWNQQWEESFSPVVVEDKIAIRAGFHEPIKNMEHEIIITPKMSFGTGHHATTYLMIQQMLLLDFNNKNVIDFGTGTGVLAILAEKFGAAKVLAVDYDEWCIENSKENIEKNNCTKITLEQASVFPGNSNFDIVLANITLNVITANIGFITSSLKKGAKVVFSGFLKTDEDKMAGTLKEHELVIIKQLQKGNWIAILAEKY